MRYPKPKRFQFPGHLNFHERKADRTELFQRWVFGWKQRPCGACAGSGYYDNKGSPPCGACEGTGKESYNPAQQKPLRIIQSGTQAK